MYATHRRAAELGLLLPLLFLQSPIFQQVLVRLLNLSVGEFVQLAMADAGDRVFLHGSSVVSRYGGPDLGLAYNSNHSRSHSATVYSPEREMSSSRHTEIAMGSVFLTSAWVLLSVSLMIRFLA